MIAGKGKEGNQLKSVNFQETNSNNRDIWNLERGDYTSIRQPAKFIDCGLGVGR